MVRTASFEATASNTNLADRYEMGCYECGANRSVRSVWGKKGLLEHIMREHGRYCDPNDTSKNESDHVTMQRCKQPREFSDEDIRKMRKGEQPDQRIDMSKRSAKKPYKETKFEPSI